MAIATISLSALLAVAFLGPGGLKVARAKRSLQLRDHLHIGSGLWPLIGALELAGAAGLLSVCGCRRSVSQRQWDWAC
jgi:DoxX-like family